MTEDHVEFLSLIGGSTGSSESTAVKMPHCWKSHVRAQLFMNTYPDKTDQDVLRDRRHKLDVSVTAIKLYLPLIRYIKILSSVISVDQSAVDLSSHKTHPPIHLLHSIQPKLCYEEEGPVSY